MPLSLLQTSLSGLDKKRANNTWCQTNVFSKLSHNFGGKRMMPQIVNYLKCIQADKGANLQWLYWIIISLMQDPNPEFHFIWLFAIGPLPASQQDCLWHCCEPLSYSLLSKLEDKIEEFHSGEELWLCLKERTIQCQEMLHLSLHVKLSWVNHRQTITIIMLISTV